MLPLVMYATTTAFSFSHNLRSTPPIEITSSSGWGENTSTDLRVGRLRRPRILSRKRVNTWPLIGPGDPCRASRGLR